MSNLRTTTELTTSGAIVNREEVKEQSSNATPDVNIPTKIDLRNQMREMSEKDTYDRNYRLFIMLPFTMAMFWSYFVSVIYLKLALIICAVFLVLLVLAISIRGGFFKKPLKKYANQLFGFESSNGGDTDSDVLYQFEQRQYAGLCVLISILYSSVMIIIDETYERDNHNLHLPIHTRGMALITNVLFLVFHKTVKCNERITEEKKLILEKYKNGKTIQDKLDNIDRRLHDWQKSKKLFVNCTRNRIAECICIWLCIFCLSMYAIIWDWRVFENDDVLTAALRTVFILTDSVFFVFAIYSFHTIYLHYQFPAIIMDELAASINAQTMDDLIGWWELRKFYSYCIIRHYSSAFAIMVGVATLTFIILLIFCTKHVMEGSEIYNRSGDTTLALSTCYVASFAFAVVSNATQYHANQLSHTNMICKESMALEKYRLDTFASDDIYQLESRKYENEMQHYIVNQMIQDVQNNSDVICILGISINANFMLLLRAASGTAAIAMISIIFS